MPKPGLADDSGSAGTYALDPAHTLGGKPAYLCSERRRLLAYNGSAWVLYPSSLLRALSRGGFKARALAYDSNSGADAAVGWARFDVALPERVALAPKPGVRDVHGNAGTYALTNGTVVNGRPVYLDAAGNNLIAYRGAARGGGWVLVRANWLYSLVHLGSDFADPRQFGGVVFDSNGGGNPDPAAGWARFDASALGGCGCVSGPVDAWAGPGRRLPC